ncbi:RNA polymerase sigma factor [Phenylobacterium sp.]|uniref:RNA polymerase sigma factor n=1 Tax=Phenylobacterium sp. TaxID=1871053 RepID=UPI002F403565
MEPSGPSERREESPLVQAFFEKRETLLLFLAARTRSMVEAEDLIQDLYLKIAAADASEVRTPAALLYRMAANLAVDHIRSARRASGRDARWRLETRATLGGEDVVPGPAADETIAERQRARLLAEAVADLPPQMGRAFRLNKLEGLTQAKTAEAMGISQKMVEHHIQAAIRKLAERLRP